MRRNGDIGAAGGGRSRDSAPSAASAVAICKALEQNDLLQGAEMQSCAAAPEFSAVEAIPAPSIQRRLHRL